MVSKASTMKAWIKRRRDKGEEPNADAIWQRINHNWPNIEQSRKEAIFQACKQ